eukprot:286680-Pleurochrysis_carterae.AAC.1
MKSAVPRLSLPMKQKLRATNVTNTIRGATVAILRRRWRCGGQRDGRSPPRPLSKHVLRLQMRDLRLPFASLRWSDQNAVRPAADMFRCVHGTNTLSIVVTDYQLRISKS